MAGEQIRLLVIEDVPQVASHIAALLNAQSQIKLLQVIASGDMALAAVAEYRPDVVIIDALLQGRVSGASVASTIRRANPEVALISLTVPQNPVQEDADLGIDAVLRMPFTGFDLTTLVRRVHEERGAESARGRSLMIALFSPKGGVGRTTIAYNLAVLLAATHRVCLVDGSMQFSDLRGLLRVPADAPSIVNLPTDQIRETDLSEVMWRDPSGIDILLAPPRVEMAEMVTVGDIEKTLSLLRKLYDFVILDTRASLSDDVLVYLDAADVILQVLSYDSMAIRGLAMAGETFRAIGYPATKLTTLMNRADALGGISRAEVEETMGHKIDHELPSEGLLVLAANNEGLPFVSVAPDAPITQAMRALASSFAARLDVQTPAAAGRR